MQSEPIIGIYRLYDKAGEGTRSFVGFSYNVVGTMKRLRFELALNACSYKQLQQFYTCCTDPQLEVLEEYTPEMNMDDVELQMHLQARVLAWCDRLKGSEPVQQQI